MADPNPSAPRPGPRPLTVEFIDNHLPAAHSFFLNPPVHYDAMSSQYIPNSQGSGLLSHSSAVSAPILQQPSDVSLPDKHQPRPEWTDIDAMELWNSIFPEALTKFLSTTIEPKEVAKSPYGIRDKNDWNMIYKTLELARDQYQKTNGFSGLFRKTRRKAASNAALAAGVVGIATNVTPNNPYSTPVLGAIGVILDALIQADNVRTKALEGFSGMVESFSEVEFYMRTFPEDSNIKGASLELTVTTLTAIEMAIRFFISNSFIRGGKALLAPSEYEKTLLSSLEDMNARSEKLVREAAKSHIHESHMFSQELPKTRRELSEGQYNLSKQTASGFNKLNSLLEELIRRQDEVEQGRKDLDAARKANMYLAVENQRLRSVSPVHISQWGPPAQPQAPWYISQEVLRRMLDSPDLDWTDMAFILNKKEELPAKQRVQAEQIINTPLFREWIVSTSSTKLLVQWESRLPKVIAEISPLSVFCTAMVQALESNGRFMSIQWFCGRHIEVSGAARAMLFSLISQLLRQQDFDTQPLHHEISLPSLQEGSIGEFQNLLVWLVRRLPRSMILFCLVDGVVYYEREEHWMDAKEVLGCLFSLTTDPSILATVKVLVTSTPGPSYVRVAFQEENLILNVDALPRLEGEPSEERLVRELCL